MLVPLYPVLAPGRLRPPAFRRGRRRGPGPAVASDRGRPPWQGTLPPPALFARCRHALQEGLRLLAEGRGLRRLWLPAVLCRCVEEVVRGAGLAAALYDLDGRLQPDLGTVDPCPGDGLLVIHYFGLALPVDRLAAACRQRGLLLVEDCAHALPDPAAGVRVGGYGEIAVFSLRKQAPVPDGGLLVVNDPGLRARVRIPQPAGLGGAAMAVKLAQMVAERLAFAAGWNLIPLKQRLMGLGGHDQEPGGRAPEGPAAPAQPGLAPPPPPSRLVGCLLGLVDWTEAVGGKQERYRRLAARLRDIPGLGLPAPRLPPGSVPQLLPILVADPARTLRHLHRRGVEAMPWPGHEGIALDRRRFPGAAAWLDRGLCLPLGAPLTDRQLDRVAAAVREAGQGLPAVDSVEALG